VAFIVQPGRLESSGNVASINRGVFSGFGQVREAEFFGCQKVQVKAEEYSQDVDKVRGRAEKKPLDFPKDVQRHGIDNRLSRR
jgi:hypothetical protein